MNSKAKFLWFLTAFFFVFLMVSRYLFGGWHDIFWYPFSAFLIGFILSIIYSFRFFLDFFSIKTTKQSLSMGTLIVIMMALLTSLNLIVVKKDKSFDLTEEKIHSLDQSTIKVLTWLKEKSEVIILYMGAEELQEKARLKTLLNRYKEKSSLVNLKFINAIEQRGKAEEYYKRIGRSSSMVVFVKQKNKMIRVQSPFSEQTVTEAFARLFQRESLRKVYFVSGHGEKELFSEKILGLGLLKEELASLAFESHTLYLSAPIPGDAAVVAIVGSRRALKEQEIQVLKRYLARGGSLFIAVDPGERHEINRFLKPFGVIFKNNYVVNYESKMIGRGIGGAFGLIFSKQSPITRLFSTKSVTLFDVASSLEKIELKNMRVEPLVSSNDSSMVVSSLINPKKPNKEQSYILGVSVELVLDKKKTSDSSNKKLFRLVVFGDSDFLSDRDIILGKNRELALNSFSFLTRDSNLVTITPKKIRGDQFVLTDSNFRVWRVVMWSMTFGFFLISILLWWRRRSA